MAASDPRVEGTQVKRFKYQSGEEVKPGDRIRYHGEPGEVEFIVADRSGDPQRDWYLGQFPGGGFMIIANGFGGVFVGESDIDEDLEFVARSGRA
jgi:hypothetical protein